MRFIRDIINDTRTEPASGQAAGASQPLMLEDPTFPEPSASDIASAGPETEDGFDDFDSFDEEDEELEAMMRSLEAEEAGQPKAADALTATEPEEDPFERLHSRNIAAAASNPPTSPLRNLRKSPGARLAAPIAEKDVSSPSDEEISLDALTPLADATAVVSPKQTPLAKSTPAGKSGRVKTRLLGFSAGAIERKDPFEKKASLSAQFPVGWLVVTSDKGRGAAFALHDGVSKIGRGTDQTVCLDFGDNSISRDNHLSIAFDAEQNKFFVGHSGKSNLVRLNNKPLLSTEELRSKDMIRLGETTLRFIALCEDDFGWEQPPKQAARHG